MKTIVKALRSFNWPLWLVLAVTLLIPALYQTLRLYFLGDIPGDWGVNIASQLAWVPTLDGIALMFGAGMAVDLIPTVGCYRHLLRKERIKVEWR